MNERSKNDSTHMVEKSAFEEFNEILKLIPPKGISVEERTRLNAIIREKLPSLSMEALSLLVKCNDHDLSAREIEKRLDNDWSGNLEDLLNMYINLAYTANRGRIGRLMDKADDNLINRSESFSSAEIVDCAEKYGNTILHRIDIFERMISQRSDQDAIIEMLKTRGKYGRDELKRDVKKYALSLKKSHPQ